MVRLVLIAPFFMLEQRKHLYKLAAFRVFQELFRDESKTEFVVVTIPSMLAVAETERLVAQLREQVCKVVGGMTHRPLAPSLFWSCRRPRRSSAHVAFLMSRPLRFVAKRRSPMSSWLSLSTSNSLFSCGRAGQTFARRSDVGVDFPAEQRAMMAIA